MTYREAAARLGIEAVCFDPACGLNAYRHRGSVDGFAILHWRERRMSRRGLRQFLLLAARRERLADPRYLNDARQFGWLYLYADSVRADQWAAELEVRFPAAFSIEERARCRWLASKTKARLSRFPTVYAWAYYSLRAAA